MQEVRWAIYEIFSAQYRLHKVCKKNNCDFFYYYMSTPCAALAMHKVNRFTLKYANYPRLIT